ncbi:MAG: DMT family transporter [Clostridia bacterium]|nr:DMT family transporter [Clostridia bacterium]
MLYSFLALLSGGIVAAAILMNARLGALRGLNKGAFINYAAGLVLAIPIALAFGRGSIGSYAFEPGDLIALTGGAIGYFVVILNNHITPRIGIIFVTILLFIGQIGTGAIIDAVRTGDVSIGRTIGGLLIMIGLIYLVFAEKSGSDRDIT